MYQLHQMQRTNSVVCYYFTIPSHLEYKNFDAFLLLVKNRPELIASKIIIEVAENPEVILVRELAAKSESAKEPKKVRTIVLAGSSNLGKN
jgi:hypothetical protein